jgi:hypothetical protein
VKLTALLFAAGIALPAMAADLPERLSTADMVGYLTQSVCLDAAGKPDRTLLPVEAACQHRRPQTPDDPVYYRKHDWPDVTDPRHPILGYQASDSVIESMVPPVRILQSFDFGDTQRAFGRFDAGQGDGGQALIVTDDAAGIAMTEDGGDGVQWFIGDRCRTAPTSDARFLGWLAFAGDVAFSQWHDAVAHLNKTRDPGTCPARFNAAYTRYRLRRLVLPFRIVATDGAVATESVPLEVVLSEHYGSDSIETASHLERFYFAHYLGLVRWERWENPAVRHHENTANDAAVFRRSQRCPQLDMHEAVDRMWDLVDCRTWTNLVRMNGDWTVADYRWDALAKFGDGDPGR